MKIKYTQTTVKYGITTVVGAFAAGVTPITFWGGTDYTLANAAITSPYYSTQKAPQGFPLSPTKWTVEATDINDRTQASPVQNTWYNLGNFGISIPIGSWKVSYQAIPYGSMAASTLIAIKITLSTANNSESDNTFTGYLELAGASGTLGISGACTREKTLFLTSKTSYYLNILAVVASMGSLEIKGTISVTIIRAVCAYL